MNYEFCEFLIIPFATKFFERIISPKNQNSYNLRCGGVPTKTKFEIGRFCMKKVMTQCPILGDTTLVF